jgi:hypothetical protein
MTDRIVRFALRIAGAAVTFTFVVFAVASGQTQSQTFSLNATKTASVDSISPLYGIPVLYGVPMALYQIRGTIRSKVGNAALGNAKVMLEDTAAKTAIDSATSDSNGVFLLDHTASAVSAHSWLLKVTDSTGDPSATYLEKDTLLSFSPGVTTDSTTIELYLDKNSTKVTAGSAPNHQSAPSLIAAYKNGAIGIRYGLPIDGLARIGVFAANGTLVRSLNGMARTAGNHTIETDANGLSAGNYFVKLTSGSFAAITKITITR